MTKFTLSEIETTWKQIAKNQDGNIPINFELKIYKKLLELFHVGDYYYYIFNTANAEIEHTSEGFEKIIGYPPKTFTVGWILENMHPEDKPRFYYYEKLVSNFFNELDSDKVLKYKVSYDYRVKTKSGKYKWILQQVTTVQTDVNGSVLRVIGVHTDISHIKSNQIPSGLSFIGLENETSILNYQDKNSAINILNDKFTLKEKEILKLVVQGNTSKEIAEKLHKSIHTINTHRKNIFQKTESKTIADLISKSIDNNWI